MIYIVTLEHTYGTTDGTTEKATELKHFEIEQVYNSSLDIVAEAINCFYDEGFQLYIGDTLKVIGVQEVETEKDRDQEFSILTAKPKEKITKFMSSDQLKSKNEKIKIIKTNDEPYEAYYILCGEKMPLEYGKIEI